MGYYFWSIKSFSEWAKIEKKSKIQVGFIGECSVPHFSRFRFRFTLKLYILGTFEHWLSSYQKWCDMTSLNRNFLKEKFEGFSPKFLMKDVKLMPNEVLEILSRYLRRFWAIEKMQGEEKDIPPRGACYVNVSSRRL